MICEEGIHHSSEINLRGFLPLCACSTKLSVLGRRCATHIDEGATPGKTQRCSRRLQGNGRAHWLWAKHPASESTNEPRVTNEGNKHRTMIREPGDSRYQNNNHHHHHHHHHAGLWRVFSFKYFIVYAIVVVPIFPLLPPSTQPVPHSHSQSPHLSMTMGHVCMFFD